MIKMRNTLIAGAVLLAVPAAQASFILADDFEAYPADSSIHGQGNWEIVTGSQVDVVANPNGGGQVLKFHTANTNRASLSLLGENLVIGSGTTGTLFFRARFDSNSGNNFSMMTAHVERPSSTGAAGHVASRLFAHNDANLRAFNGSTHDVLDPYDIEQWYDVWFVVNNTAQTTEFYIQGGAFANQTKLDFSDGTDEFAFRFAQGDDLRSFWGHTFDTATYYLDDIYVDTAGANLANPIPEPSTYAMLFGAAALLFAGIRRRLRRS